jgi:hypothetical protein
VEEASSLLMPSYRYGGTMTLLVTGVR